MGGVVQKVHEPCTATAMEIKIFSSASSPSATYHRVIIYHMRRGITKNYGFPSFSISFSFSCCFRTSESSTLSSLVLLSCVCLINLLLPAERSSSSTQSWSPLGFGSASALVLCVFYGCLCPIQSSCSSISSCVIISGSSMAMAISEITITPFRSSTREGKREIDFTQGGHQQQYRRHWFMAHIAHSIHTYIAHAIHTNISYGICLYITCVPTLETYINKGPLGPCYEEYIIHGCVSSHVPSLKLRNEHHMDVYWWYKVRGFI